MAEHINAKDSLNEGRKKLNNSIDASARAEGKSDRAINTSNSALDKARESNNKSEETQTQLDNIVLENGDSEAEVVQARGEEDLLYKRLDKSDARLVQTETSLNSLNTANSDEVLPILNYLGNYQNIHPKVLYFENEWNGYKYWMAYTPYPKGSTDAENPCIAVSNDMLSWEVPEGVTNPLDGTPDEGYNSDTHLVYREDTDVLEVWWRLYATDDDRRIYRRTSNDGKTWSEKELLLKMPDDHGVLDMLSPAVIFEDNKYKVWYCRAGTLSVYYRELSSDGLGWTDEEQLDINWWKGNLTPWHMDVIKSELGYELLVQAYDRDTGNNNTADLYHVIQSNDSFTIPKKVLSRNENPDAIDHAGIYRSCILKKNSVYYVIYSTIDKDSNRGLALSIGNSIYGLNGFENKSESKVLEVWNEPTIDGLDVGGYDIVRFTGSDKTIHSLGAGKRRQRLTLILGSSDVKVTLKSSGFALPTDGDYVLTGSQRIVDLVYDRDVWKVYGPKPSGEIIDIYNKNEVKNLNVGGINMIRFTGNTTPQVKSFAGGYHGQRLTLVIGTSSNKVKITNSDNISTPNEEEYILDASQRVVDLIKDGDVWKVSAYRPINSYEKINKNLVDYDVSQLDVLMIDSSVTIESFKEASIGKAINIVISGSSTVATIKSGDKMVPPGNVDFDLDITKIGMTCICTAFGVWRCF